MIHQVTFGSQKIDFELTTKSRKTLGIKVHPDGFVEVLAPEDLSEGQIIEKVRKKAAWILKQLDFFNIYKPPTPPRRFINGETHHYLGRQYRLKIVPAEYNDVKAYRGNLVMYCFDKSPESLKKQLESWYRERASVIFKQVLQEAEIKFHKYKIKEPVLLIRKMNKRWGSCTPAGKITLNPELIKAPKGSIEYIIIHELTHLVHYSHNKAFQDLQNRMMPDWQKWKERLEFSLI